MQLYFALFWSFTISLPLVSPFKSICPRGQYPSGGMCLDCPETCQDCLSEAICLKCEESLVLYENLCLLKCPEGYFGLDNDEYLQKECIKPSVTLDLAQNHYRWPPGLIST